jgi:uncharacterized protein YutE (UPF0331/DUF86 family)
VSANHSQLVNLGILTTMKLNGVVARTLAYYQEVLSKLKSCSPVSSSQLQNDWQLRRCIERDLQVLIEIITDICLRIVAVSGSGPIDSGGRAIEKCVGLGVLANEEPYRRMVKFRNLIAHAYEEVDLDILVTVVNQHIGDFELFYSEVLPHVEI